LALGFLVARYHIDARYDDSALLGLGHHNFASFAFVFACDDDDGVVFLNV
jgi:hypothetical protein